MKKKKQTKKEPPLKGKVVRTKRKYDPVFKEQVIQLGQQGKSIMQIASIFGVHRTMLYKWAQDEESYPGFKDAMDLAREAAEAYWEEVMQRGIMGQIKGFNQISAIYMMKARFHEWRETNAPQKIEVTRKVELLSDADLDKKLIELQGDDTDGSEEKDSSD